MFTLNCKGRLLTVDKPLVMGIINITPDSFYSGSRHQSLDAIIDQAGQMLNDGATILDIGGQSTRPGSERIDDKRELDRVLEPVAAINKHFPTAFISIDTYYSLVAREAVNAGGCIINDISAGKMDSNMLSTVVELQTPYILMHMQGDPATMQVNPQYNNVTAEVLDFFILRIKDLADRGIKDVIIDPGFGFGKTSAHNFELLRNLQVFSMLDCPLLLGISRKATIYKTLGVSPEEALNGTTVLNTIGLVNGAMILRVHDVKAAVETITLYTACMK
jgi:dihydropteroate synthase